MDKGVKKEKSNFLNNRSLIIVLAVAVLISVTASAMTVDKFNDYSPPSTLYIDWYDYFEDMGMSDISQDNYTTEWPRWSVAYPYRALFLGRTNDSAKRYQYIMIYSKKPTTSLFTFEYTTGKSSRYGYIRAKINTTAYTSSDEIAIVYQQFTDVTSVPFVSHPSFWGTYITTGHTTGSDTYFDFDFYYDCTDKHQQNTQLLSVSGLRNISVPYAYILTCDDPPPGGSTSGSSSGSGSGSGGSDSSSSGGGGSSSGGSSSYPWEDDKNTPDLSGGSSSGSSGSSDSGYTVGEDTTGEKGDTWELPEYKSQDMPWSTDDLNIPSMPEIRLPEIPEPSFNFPAMPEPSFNFPAVPGMPDVELPPVPYEPGVSTWPPPFPGTN